MHTTLRILIAAAMLLGAPLASADDNPPLLSNGNFEAARADGSGPQDWPTSAHAQWLEEDGNHFLRVSADPGKTVVVYRVLPVKPEHEAYRLTFRYRVHDLKRGKANWHDGRIILDFKDKDGTKLKPSGPAPSFKGSTDGWQDKDIDFLVPQGATKLEFMPAIFNAESGSYDLDDLALTLTDPQPIRDRAAEAAKKKAEDVARRAAAVKPQVPVAPADKLPPMLHVEGNKIKDAAGNEVWLQGLAVPSMEWSGGGESILRSVGIAINEWNANVIRLGIREHFWSGVGPYQADGGAYYRQLVDDVVNLCAANGKYVVIDLHRFRAPEPKHAAFWQEVATKYKDHPAVLFELFNEAHDLSWQVWRDGGFVSTEKNADPNVVAENTEKLKGFESIGMQALVDAVRETGARNIVIAGGLDWSYDLSGVINGYALDDRGGNGIVYSSHVYIWKSDWQGKFMDVAEKHPIFIGECGATPERLPFIPKSMPHEDPHIWVPDFLGTVQAHKYHWTGWSFHPRASPCVIADWDYTPTEYWGAYAKEALAGKVYEAKKLR